MHKNTQNLVHLWKIERKPFEKQNQLKFIYSSQEYSQADEISGNNIEDTQANKAQQKCTRHFMKIIWMRDAELY